MTAEVEWKDGMVQVSMPRCVLLLTEKEWAEGIRRGKLALRRRRAEEREARYLDEKISAAFPRFE